MKWLNGALAKLLTIVVGGREVVWLRAVAVALAVALVGLVYHHHTGLMADLAACRAGLGMRR